MDEALLVGQKMLPVDQCRGLGIGGVETVDVSTFQSSQFMAPGWQLPQHLLFYEPVGEAVPIVSQDGAVGGILAYVVEGEVSKGAVPEVIT